MIYYYSIDIHRGAAVLDTYKFVTKLKSKGFTEEQASALSEEINDVIHEGGLATGHDIILLKKDIESLRQETKSEITLVRKDIDLLKWMIGFLLAMVLPIFIKTVQTLF